MKKTREQLIHEAATSKDDSAEAFRRRQERWLELRDEQPWTEDTHDSSDPRLSTTPYVRSNY